MIHAVSARMRRLRGSVVASVAGAALGIAVLLVWANSQPPSQPLVEVRSDGLVQDTRNPKAALAWLDEQVGYHVLWPHRLPQNNLHLAFVDAVTHEGIVSPVIGYSTPTGEDNVIITFSQSEGAGFAPSNRSIPLLEDSSDDRVPKGMTVWRVPGGVQDIYWFQLPERGYFIIIMGRLYFPASAIIEMVESIR